MAQTPKPTNEHIIEMLDHILRELGSMKASHEQLAADLRKIAEKIEH